MILYLQKSLKEVKKEEDTLWQIALWADMYVYDNIKVWRYKYEGTRYDVYVVLCLFLDNSDSPSIVEQ